MYERQHKGPDSIPNAKLYTRSISWLITKRARMLFYWCTVRFMIRGRRWREQNVGILHGITCQTKQTLRSDQGGKCVYIDCVNAAKDTHTNDEAVGSCFARQDKKPIIIMSFVPSPKSSLLHYSTGILIDGWMDGHGHKNWGRWWILSIFSLARLSYFSDEVYSYETQTMLYKIFLIANCFQAYIVINQSVVIIIG